MSASSCLTSTYCTLDPRAFSSAAQVANVMKHISGCPPSRATKDDPSIRASSIDSPVPLNRTPARRVTSAERLTPQKLSEGPGAVTGNQAWRPETFAYEVVTLRVPNVTSPCTPRFGNAVDQLVGVPAAPPTVADTVNCPEERLTAIT